jgi:hypothetical protein
MYTNTAPLFLFFPTPTSAFETSLGECKVSQQYKKQEKEIFDL